VRIDSAPRTFGLETPFVCSDEDADEKTGFSKLFLHPWETEITTMTSSSLCLDSLQVPASDDYFGRLE
jgi:hypothetical protein